MNVKTPPNLIKGVRTDSHLIFRGRNMAKIKKEFFESSYHHLRRKGNVLFLLYPREEFIDIYFYLRRMGYTFEFTYEQYPEILNPSGAPAYY